MLALAVFFGIIVLLFFAAVIVVGIIEIFRKDGSR